MQIINVPSPNFSKGRKGYHPEAIVIHIMEGTLSGTDSWFRNPQSKVSAHYGVGTNGELHQYVQETDTAWHAGRVNAPVWSFIKPTGNGQFINPNYYTIGIEHEGNENTNWTEDMYNTTSSLISEISKRWNIPLDRRHIIGHHEIYSLKTCPGFNVDLERLVQMSKQKSGYIPESDFISGEGKVRTGTNLNLRKNSPSTKSPVFRTAVKGEELSFIGYTDNGESVKNIKRWYKTPDGNWFWSGGVISV
jgi:N-acetylmuramoyl-L-alanine amidase